MEDAFPGVPLEEQSGKIKWFAPDQAGRGREKPDAVKIDGKVAMRLCDDNGYVMPKDYKFTATYQPDATPEKEAAEPPKERRRRRLPNLRSLSGPRDSFRVSIRG